MLSLIPIKFWFHNTHRVYTLCLNSARCVCVCMHVCVHPYLVIMQSNSDSELFNIYHPHPPHLPNCSSVNKAMWTQLLRSTTMNTCLELTRSAQLWFSWSESEGHLSGSTLSLWNDLNQNSRLSENQSGFIKNGQIALGVAYSCSKIPSSNGPACGHLLHGRKLRVLRVRADLPLSRGVRSPHPSELYAFCLRNVVNHK